MNTTHICGVVGLVPLMTFIAPPHAPAQSVPARDLGVPFEGIAGIHNAITDVPGVQVGHTTIIRGDGPLEERVNRRIDP